MAYKLVNKEWSPHLDEYTHEYIVDTETDIASLPECAVGSSALVVASATVYMVNASGEWAVFGG